AIEVESEQSISGALAVICSYAIGIGCAEFSSVVPAWVAVVHDRAFVPRTKDGVAVRFLRFRGTGAGGVIAVLFVRESKCMSKFMNCNGSDAVLSHGFRRCA